MQNQVVGESPLFLAMLDKVSKLAAIDRPVLILGERGTGKELVAQRLHYLSSRWNAPLISLNCATLSEGVIDSELFGHESGAFTGATGRHQGRFERAENGTLFLDELATAPLRVQEKLLRIIEYGQYERVGGHQTLQANVRLICATHADLPALAQSGKFRADLLDRLAFDVIHLPPLRVRQDDILILANHYAMKMCQELALPLFVGFADSARQQLLAHSWPGNVRELKNVVERAVYQHAEQSDPITTLELDPFQIPWQTAEQTNTSSALLCKTDGHAQLSAHYHFPLNYKEWQENQDRQLLQQAMETAQYNQRHAAELLGLSYDQLRGMIRKYGIRRSLNI